MFANVHFVSSLPCTFSLSLSLSHQSSGHLYGPSRSVRGGRTELVRPNLACIVQNLSHYFTSKTLSQIIFLIQIKLMNHPMSHSLPQQLSQLGHGLAREMGPLKVSFRLPQTARRGYVSRSRPISVAQYVSHMGHIGSPSKVGIRM